MKIKLFDVVELKKGNRATILSINKENYSAEIVDNKGISLGVQEIVNSDIEKIIFRR